MKRHRESSTLPLLAFHSLDFRPSPISFPPELFRRGLESLHEAGYGSITAGAAASFLRERRPWPDRTLALSFDDGYLSVLENGFPVLEKLGYTATIFLTAGKGHVHCLPPMQGRPRLGWEQVRLMHRAGIEIGAHTMTHPDLTRLDEAQIEAEMAGSRAAIEDAIGARVTSFSYPFGFHNALARKIVRRHFDCACSGDLGLLTAESDPCALERLEMHYFRNPATFHLLSGPLLPSYIRLRKLPRLIRQTVLRRLGERS